MGIVEGRISGLIATFPKTVNYRRHQPQHAAGALELGERGPIGIQPVENLRMNRVGRLNAPLVVHRAALRRELDSLRTVQVGEGAGGDVALLEGVRPAERFEQPPPHDLEAFLGACRPPRGFDPGDDIAQPFQRLAPAQAAHFGIVRLGVRRTLAGRVGRRQGHYQQTVFRGLHGFRERLGECELGLEAAGWQIALVVQLARVGDPFIDQNEARAVGLQQFAQRVARIGGVLVVGADALECRFAAQLVSQFAPQRAYGGAVRLDGGTARRNLVAD